MLTATESDLINLIRDHDNPEQALSVAVSVILDYLRQHGSLPTQQPADRAVSA